MKFKEWLSKTGHKPLEVIKSNYRMSGYSEKHVEKVEKRLREDYTEWKENK